MIYLLTTGDYSSFGVQMVVEGEEGKNVEVEFQGWVDMKAGPIPSNENTEYKDHNFEKNPLHNWLRCKNCGCVKEYEKSDNCNLIIAIGEWNTKRNDFGRQIKEFCKDSGYKILDYKEMDVSVTWKEKA